MFKTGIIDKKEAVLECVLSSGQKGGCFFTQFLVLNFLDNIFVLSSENGSRLCWRATCQGYT